jgi:hypothetical protein
MRKLAQAAVRHVLAADRNPVLRLVELAYDPTVSAETQVAAASAAAPFLFPKKSLEMTATLALDHPDAATIIDRLLRQCASLKPQNTIEALPLETVE